MNLETKRTVADIDIGDKFEEDGQLWTIVGFNGSGTPVAHSDSSPPGVPDRELSKTPQLLAKIRAYILKQGTHTDIQASAWKGESESKSVGEGVHQRILLAGWKPYTGDMDADYYMDYDGITLLLRLFGIEDGQFYELAILAQMPDGQWIRLLLRLVETAFFNPAYLPAFRASFLKFREQITPKPA